MAKLFISFTGAARTAALTVGLALLAAATPLVAHAQSLPSGAEPGRPRLAPVMPTPSTPGRAIAVPQSSGAEAPAGAENYSFTLKRVMIEGARHYRNGELDSFYAGLVGKEITVRDAFKIANDIEVRYRNDGYITTRVMVPEQTIDDGIFHIKVIEGWVSDIVYPDDIGPAKAAVARLLDPLRDVAPINVSDIERRLLLADDLPGLTVRGSLEPSPDKLGGSVIVVKTERKGYDASATVDNRNSPYLGDGEITAVAAANSIGPNADRISLNGQLSSPLKRSWSLGASYDALLNSNGLTGSLTSSYSQTNPGLDLDSLGVDSWVMAEVGTLSYPLIRSRLTNLRLTGEFEFRNAYTDIADDEFNRDRLRILRGGFSFDHTDTLNGITAVRAMVHQGLPVMNATEKGSALASRSSGDSEYTKLTVDVTRIQQLTDRVSLLATATSQFTNRPLLASEEIGLGGADFARGYDDGEVSGDYGWAGSLEFRYSPSLEKYFPRGIQFFAFYDGGQVWSKSDILYEGSETLVSAGGGVRVNLLDNVFATLELDQPLSRNVQTEGNNPTRVFFTLTAHY